MTSLNDRLVEAVLRSLHAGSSEWDATDYATASRILKALAEALNAEARTTHDGPTCYVADKAACWFSYAAAHAEKGA